MANLKNDWQESDIVMNTDMNDIANEINSKLNSDFSNVSGGAVPISNGGTGATTVDDAKNNLGLGTSSWVTFGKTICESIEIVTSSPYPFIDFSPNSQTDYEVRIAKNDTNQLNIEALNGNANLCLNGNKVYNSGSNMTDLQREICANNKGFFVCQNWWADTGFTSDVNTWINTGVYNMIGYEVTNVPTDTDGWGTIAVFQCDKSVIQFAHFWNANTFYARKGGYDSNTQSYIFNDWQRIGSPYVQQSQPNNAPNNSLWAW